MYHADVVLITPRLISSMARGRTKDDGLTEAPRLYPNSSIYMAMTGS